MDEEGKRFGCKTGSSGSYMMHAKVNRTNSVQPVSTPLTTIGQNSESTPKNASEEAKKPAAFSQKVESGEGQDYFSYSPESKLETV